MTPSPEEVQSWLEWAGERLMALPVQGTRPAGYRSFWPDFPQEHFTAYGYGAPRLRFPPPAKAEIPVMDEIYDLIPLTENHLERRLLQARSLIGPFSGRYIHSWNKLGPMLHLDRRTAKKIHYLALCNVAQKVPVSVVGRFRDFIGGPPS